MVHFLDLLTFDTNAKFFQFGLVDIIVMAVVTTVNVQIRVYTH